MTAKPAIVFLLLRQWASIINYSPFLQKWDVTVSTALTKQVSNFIPLTYISHFLLNISQGKELTVIVEAGISANISSIQHTPYSMMSQGCASSFPAKIKLREMYTLDKKFLPFFKGRQLLCPGHFLIHQVAFYERKLTLGSKLILFRADPCWQEIWTFWQNCSPANESNSLHVPLVCLTQQSTSTCKRLKCSEGKKLSPIRARPDFLRGRIMNLSSTVHQYQSGR